MRNAALPLCLGLCACTGLNLDETFVETHGAALAQVKCENPSGPSIIYRATMFWDGSVQASANFGQLSGSVFFERDDADRTNAPVPLQSSDGDCGGGPFRFVAIETGDLNVYVCQGSPSAYDLVGALDLSTDCTGFNKGLFD